MQKKNRDRNKSFVKMSIVDAHAHCDIPCKIYDPSTAQIAALTVIRMIDIIEEAIADDGLHPYGRHHREDRTVHIVQDVAPLSPRADSWKNAT